MPTRCNRGFYCRSYCLLNMFRASLCPSSGAQEYYTVVAACVILCCKNVGILFPHINDDARSKSHQTWEWVWSAFIALTKSICITVVSPYSSVIYLGSCPQQHITTNFIKRRSFQSFAQHLTHDAFSRHLTLVRATYPEHLALFSFLRTSPQKETPVMLAV